MKQIEVSGADEQIIDRLIASGLCKDAKEVLHISLQMLREAPKERLERLRDDIAIGVAAADEGRLSPSNAEEAKKQYRAQRTTS
jgi:Arc/MetJ-type ribon-helix-helix transcriptional regulator